MPSPEAVNRALGWMHNTVRREGQVTFAGIWQDSWKRDFPAGAHPRTKAVLSLYDDAAADARALLDHLGVYAEVTNDSIGTARLRMTAAGFSDVTVTADKDQRYVLARKAGR